MKDSMMSFSACVIICKTTTTLHLYNTVLLVLFTYYSMIQKIAINIKFTTVSKLTEILKIA